MEPTNHPFYPTKNFNQKLPPSSLPCSPFETRVWSGGRFEFLLPIKLTNISPVVHLSPLKNHCLDRKFPFQHARFLNMEFLHHPTPRCSNFTTLPVPDEIPFKIRETRKVSRVKASKCWWIIMAESAKEEYLAARRVGGGTSRVGGGKINGLEPQKTMEVDGRWVSFGNCACVFLLGVPCSFSGVYWNSWTWRFSGTKRVLW